MKINVYKKEFKSFNEKVVKCTLYVGITVHEGGFIGTTHKHIKCVGKAKMHPDEPKFSLEVGKQIAYDKAYAKVLRQCDKYVRSLIDEKKQEITNLQGSLDYVKRKCERFEKNKFDKWGII